MWNDVKEFTQSADKAQSVGDLNHIFGQMVQSWGFANFVAIQVSSRQMDLRAPLTKSFGKPPILWLNRYKQAGHVHRDAGIARIMSSTEPYWWSDVQAQDLSPQEQLVFGEAAEFGLAHGLVVPVRPPDGSVWSCLLSAQDVEESDELRLAAVVAANFYVGRGTLLQTREARHVDLAYRLTPRQREIVQWLASGLTADEIGEVLNITGHTVLNQLDLAKKRLNARTLAALVAEAIIHGEIILGNTQ